MRYTFTVAGKRYGPADLAQLNAYIAEGLLTADTELQVKGSFTTLRAGLVHGLNFPKPTAPLPPPVVSNYPRPNWTPPLFLQDENAGKRYLIYSFLLCLASPFASYLTWYGLLMPFGGIYCGGMALRKNLPLGGLGLALNAAMIPFAFAAKFHFQFD